MKIEIPYKLLWLVALLVFVGVFPMPYGYYTFMRIVTCGCAALIGYQLWNTGDRSVWVCIWGLLAILFNPIAPIHMTKEVWMVLDALTAGVFGLYGYRGYQKEG